MKLTALLLCVLFAGTAVQASDSLQISLNTKTFVKGDTLEFKCTVPEFEKLKLLTATLNVWIEDVERHNRWKFRYPMINGEVSASLAISDKIPDGRYAVNFMVQRGFFKIFGEVLDHEKKDTSLIYMMIPKNKKSSYFDNTHVAPDGSFHLKSTLFADSAFFIFSPPKKVRNNYLAIRIETPLDSAFTPVLYESHFITVGDPKMLIAKKTDTSKYQFQSEELLDINMLPNVTVTAKFKSKMQQYDDEYSRGLFQRDDTYNFDGLESDQISRAISVLMFLQGKIPGLTIDKDDTGQDVAKWRNEIVEIYVDEFKLDAHDATFVSPTEVAMIKVFRPPAQLSSFSGGAGAIAIYTRKGAYASNTKSRHNFVVKGYTNMESVWQ
jgi:hypothetical protein